MMNTMKQKNPENASQTGFLLVGMLATILPLMILVGAAGSLMLNRNNELLQRMNLEQAFLAAESGIDEAVFALSNGGLPTGVQFKRQLGPDFSFTIDPTDLGADGIDNDGDTLVDEKDEKIMEVVVTGFYLNEKRRLVAYIEPNMMKISVPGAMTFQDPTVEVELEDGFLISGIDTNLDGTPGPGPNTYGISILEPGTAANIEIELDKNVAGVVNGVGPTPSITTIPATETIDFAVLRAAIIANADLVVDGTYTNPAWGDSSVGDWKVVYCPDRLRIRTSGSGAGILFVENRLEIEDLFEWHGIIIGLDDVEFEADKDRILIRGAFVTGPAADHDDGKTEIEDSVSIIYSTEAMKAISTLLPYTGGPFHVTGWKEISAK